MDSIGYVPGKGVSVRRLCEERQVTIDVNASWKHVCACVVSCSVGCMTQGMVTVH